jgi:YfiH family protein
VLHDEGSLGPARFVVTDRTGGTSRAPYDALNLADHVGDDPGAVDANRQALAAELGLSADRLAFMRQVHGRTVARVAPSSSATAWPEADALVSTDPTVALVVLVADCVPVLLAAPGPDGPVLAVAHAGRKGVAAGVVGATVEAMRELGADVGAGQAHVGPAVCGRCYEVPADLQAQVAATVPGVVSTTREGTPGLDLPRAVLLQLVAAGVRDVGHDETCSRETPALYSHRRDGVTGRFGGVVMAAA